jgi:UrcA family protein
MTMTNLRAKFASSFFALAIAATASAASPAAFAQVGREQVTIEFGYKSWDTAAENYQVIRRIVKRACTSSGGAKSLLVKLTEQECIDGMTDMAVAQLGRPQLASLHYAATGRDVSVNIQLASAGH